MATIQTVPNQWVLTIHKEPINEDTLYARFEMTALEHAGYDLDAGAFKLWIYLAKNQDGYTFALSRADIEKRFNMGKTQYDKARKELVSKGYLVNERGNYYIFYERPKILTEEEKEEHRQKADAWEEQQEIKKIIKELTQPKKEKKLMNFNY